MATLICKIAGLKNPLDVLGNPMHTDCGAEALYFFENQDSATVNCFFVPALNSFDIYKFYRSSRYNYPFEGKYS